MTTPLFAPFRGWLVRPEWAERVVAGAYDAKSPAERRAIVEANPFSYFGVTRSHEDLTDDDELTDDDLLELGAATLRRILDAGAFRQVDRPSLFAYRLEYGGHTQTGVVGALAVEALLDGRVLTHENVRPERAALLGRHLAAIGATSSPIALTHEPDPTVGAVIERVTTRNTPDLDHVVEGVRHRVWTLTGSEADDIAAALADATVFVTDGHHRSAAARSGFEQHPDDPAFARTLAALFPADELRVEAFHRRAPDRSQRPPEQLADALRTVGTVTAVDDGDAAKPTTRGEIGVYAGGRWYRLVLDPAERPTPLAGLDVERLRRDVIGHVLGVDELADGGEVDYVPAPTGVDELVARCDADGKVGFVMFPTDIHDLMAVAAAGQLMPPKSSYFAPKPRSGIFLRTLGLGVTTDEGAS